MKYKGYEAVVSFDEDAEIFHGEVINTKDVITFQGKAVDELKRALCAGSPTRGPRFRAGFSAHSPGT
jgi:predicted HicB family RNase H-like nuclease